uniref:Uncharacterized protein n=1 Tax=Medicago truncatula TaxID=3880 RepID=Q1RSH1_MEDTR|nr:hypothetical protein MtrDRAFT_AC161864g8v2 [Medicago truncatula]
MHGKKFIVNDPMKIKEEMNNIMYFVDIEWSETPQWLPGKDGRKKEHGGKERRESNKRGEIGENRKWVEGNGWWCV